MSFLGENPFAIKRDAIDSVMTWIFTSLAIIGILIQAFTQIWVKKIPDRQHTTCTYAIGFCVGFLVTVIIVLSLTRVGNFIARKHWVPHIIVCQEEIYKKAKFIIEHNGLSEIQLEHKEKHGDSEKYIQTNLQETDKYLSQIETMLDIPNDKTDRRERLNRLRRFFDH
jgi:hypothetical protein